MGALSTAQSIRMCSSRAAMSPAVANENARTYAEGCKQASRLKSDIKMHQLDATIATEEVQLLVSEKLDEDAPECRRS